MQGTSIHLIGVHSMDIHLISVYFIGVHLTGHALHGACISLGLHSMGVVCGEAFRISIWGFGGRSLHPTVGVPNGVIWSHYRHVTPMPPSLPSAMAVKFFKRAMREFVRLADKKMDISNARTEAIRCVRTIATAKADEEIVTRLKLFAYATREKWPKKQLNSEKNSKDALTRIS